MTHRPFQPKAFDPQQPASHAPVLPITRRQFIVRNLALFGTMACVEGLNETDQIEVTRHHLPLRNLRAPMRVVQITDLHRSWCVSEAYISRVITRTNALQPDLILLTGDFVTRSSDYAASCMQQITRLDEMKPVRSLALTEDESRAIRSYAFVSGKPLILVANIHEGDVGEEIPAIVKPLAEYAAAQGVPLMSLCAKVEMEVAQMEPEEEREFLEAMGIAEAARNRLIRAAYAALGRMSFFTVGDDEVRAWTINIGTNAVGAAGTIHSDLARGFIRAEVMSFEDFQAAGGCWDEAKAGGKMRLEGKEYIVKDGDILHVRFKV